MPEKGLGRKWQAGRLEHSLLFLIGIINQRGRCHGSKGHQDPWVPHTAVVSNGVLASTPCLAHGLREPRLPGWALPSNGAGDTWSPQHSLWCPGVSEPITFQPGRSGRSLAREILTLRLGLGVEACWALRGFWAAEPLEPVELHKPVGEWKQLHLQDTRQWLHRRNRCPLDAGCLH